jgi:hypothetical protein
MSPSSWPQPSVPETMAPPAARPRVLRLSRTSAVLGIQMLVLAFAAPVSAGEDHSSGLVPNLGQLPPEVSFYARCGGADLFFTGGDVVLDLIEEGHAIRIHLDGIASGVRAAPRGPKETRLNYFIGNDPAHWVTNVAVYSELVYPEVGPGVDLWMRPEAGGLRYGLRDHSAGAAGGRIAEIGEQLFPFRFEGVDGQSVLDDGRLRLEAGSRVIWDGPAGESPGERLLRWREVSSDVPVVDQRPDVDSGVSLAYSTFLGGGDNDRGHGLTFDPYGRPVISGYTRSSSFPVTVGAYDTTQNGEYDACVCKFSSDASALLWATFVGGGLRDRSFVVQSDGEGNFIFAGETYSTDFPTNVQAFDRTLGGDRDGFVAKINGDGNTLIWGTYLGGSDLDRVWDLDLDSQGRVVLSGETQSTDFPATPGAYATSLAGTYGQADGFTAKMDADGTSLIWCSYLGGGGTDWVKYQALDPEDRPLLCGTTTSQDFPTTPGAFDSTRNGSSDCFVARFEASGSALSYSTFVGGNLADAAEVIVSAPGGEVVVTGTTYSANFPTTPAAYDTTQNGAKDAFLLRLDADGKNLVYSTFVGGSADDDPWALVLDPDGAPIFSGYVYSDNFPVTPDALDLTHNGDADANITQLDPTGSTLLYSTYFGGSDLDGGWEMVIDPTGNPVLTGPTGSPDFPTTPGVYDRTQNGGRDIFLARFIFRGTTDAPGPALTPAPLWAAPNPASGPVRVRFDLATAGPVEVLALDAGGRLVATLRQGFEQAGTHWVQWEGRDSWGRALPSGAYWLRVVTERSTLQRKLILVH